MKESAPWPCGAKEGITAIFRRQDYDILSLPKKPCAIDQMNCLKHWAISADQDHRAIIGQPLECVEHPRAEVSA